MTREIVSKRTRNAFCEFLVGWTLREIEIAFDGGYVECDHKHNPNVSGERRAFVEQHYDTLDFKKPADARRLLVAYESIIERAKRNQPKGQGRQAAEQAIAHLETCLARDGLAYRNGTIIATTREACQAFEQPRDISDITRRAIFDELSVGRFSWHGRLSDRQGPDSGCVGTCQGGLGMTIPATNPATVARTGIGPRIGPGWPDSPGHRVCSRKEATA